MWGVTYEACILEGDNLPNCCADCDEVATEAICSVSAAARASSEGERDVVRLLPACFEDDARTFVLGVDFAGAMGV